jgi:uncharacterized SAM-binding protein YcdF (DUF218 family)
MAKLPVPPPPRRPRRALLLPLLLGPAVLWWFWPWLRPTLLPAPKADSPDTSIITVFVEDPWRTHEALRLWQQNPTALLVLQGSSRYQTMAEHHLRARGQWPLDQGRLRRLTDGCDTVGQLTTLANQLRGAPAGSRLTIVTSDTHLARSMAIGQILFAGAGWQVRGEPVIGHDSRPEPSWRLHRDQLRAQLWRAIGWDGRLWPPRCDR